MPLAVLMLPWPSFNVPFQIAEAVRCMWLSCGLRDFYSARRISCGRHAAFGLNARNCFTLATLRNPAFARAGSFHVYTKSRPVHGLDVSAVSLIPRLGATFLLDVRSYEMDLDLYDGGGHPRAISISVRVRRRRRGFAGAERMKILLDTLEAIAGDVLIDAESYEGHQSGEGPKLGAIGEFCFGLPAEKPARDFEGHQQSQSERDEIREDFDGRGGVGSGGFQAVRKVSGGHEQSCALNPVREDRKRDAGA